MPTISTFNWLITKQTVFILVKNIIDVEIAELTM